MLVCVSVGFNRSNASVGLFLHQLGPDCASSNLQAIQAIHHRCRLGYSEDHAEDTSYIRSSPIDDSDLRSLMGVSGRTQMGRYNCPGSTACFFFTENEVEQEYGLCQT